MIRGYAVFSYLLFLGTLVYFIGWLANLGVPQGIDGGRSTPTLTALVIDVALLALFAIQHSVMARPWFKRATRPIVPAAAERATYVLLSDVAVILIIVFYQPLGHVVWDIDSTPWRVLLWLTYAAGWAIAILSTMMIGQFDLFGLAQAHRGKAYVERGFGTPGFYALVRHPIMSGFLLAFWSAPTMTGGHLLFAVLSTAYVLVGVRFEERDLEAQLGHEYTAYAAEVPRFVPALRRPRVHLAKRLPGRKSPV